MTPNRPDGADALEELAGWISDRIDEAQAEAAYSPRLDRNGRMYLQGRFDALRQPLRRVKDFSDKHKVDGHGAEGILGTAQTVVRR